MGLHEFQDQLTFTTPDGQVLQRNTSWTGMRFLLAEVRIVSAFLLKVSHFFSQTAMQGAFHKV